MDAPMNNTVLYIVAGVQAIVCLCAVCVFLRTSRGRMSEMAGGICLIALAGLGVFAGVTGACANIIIHWDLFFSESDQQKQLIAIIVYSREIFKPMLAGIAAALSVLVLLLAAMRSSIRRSRPPVPPAVDKPPREAWPSRWYWIGLLVFFVLLVFGSLLLRGCGVEPGHKKVSLSHGDYGPEPYFIPLFIVQGLICIYSGYICVVSTKARVVMAARYLQQIALAGMCFLLGWAGLCLFHLEWTCRRWIQHGSWFLLSDYGFTFHIMAIPVISGAVSASLVLVLLLVSIRFGAQAKPGNTDHPAHA